MKSSSKIIIAATAASLGLVLVSLTAIASPNHGPKSGTYNHSSETPMGGNMMQMIQRMHGGENAHMGGDQSGHGQMGNYMGGNMMGGGMMGTHMQDFDTDEDGTLSADELRNGLLAELKKYDADADGTLSIEEFETLHSAHMRNAMVDRFQAFDEDGDGKVTEAEIAAHAEEAAKHMQGHSSAGQMMRMDQMHGSAAETE